MLYSIENSITLIKEYLEDNLGAKLDALDTVYGDSITLEDIEAWYVAEIPAAPAYPVGIILGERIETREQPGYVGLFEVISVAALVTDVNAETLRRRLYRYIRAFAEVIDSGQSTMGLNIFLDGAEYSPMYSQAGRYLADAHLSISILDYQDSV